MQITTNAVFGFVILVFASGCSIFSAKQSSQNNGDIYYDAAYYDNNRAPASLNLPKSMDDHSSKIDPVYMRVQADYNFARGEALSYEGKSQDAIEAFKSAMVYDEASSEVPLRLASEYAKVGMGAQALEVSKEAVKNDQNSVQAHLMLGGIYSGLKSYDKAIVEYEQVIKLDPNNFEAPAFIGAVYAEKKEYDKAVKYFEKLVKNEKYESPHIAWYYIGRIRADQEGEKNRMSALEAFDKSLNLKPNYVDSALAKAAVYLRTKNDKKALETLRVFQVQQGPNPRIAEVLSQMYLENNQYDLAYEQFEILENNSDDPLGIKVKMALILIEQKEFKKAIAKLSDVVRQVPESDKVRFYLAAVYEEVGEKENAIHHFLRINPESQYYTESMIHAAYLHREEKAYSKALSIIKSAIDNKSDVAQLHAVYASLLDEDSQTKESYEYLQFASKKFPDNVQLKFFLGTVSDKLGNKPAVVQLMKEVIQLDPEHVQAINYLAYTYAEMEQNLNEAVELSKRAVKLDPNDGYILDTYGWILFKQKKYTESIKVLEAAYKMQPNEPVIAEHLADVFFHNRMADKARLWYEKAIAFQADDSKITKIRQKIMAIEKQELYQVKNGKKPEDRSPASLPASLNLIPEND